MKSITKAKADKMLTSVGGRAGEVDITFKAESSGGIHFNELKRSLIDDISNIVKITVGQLQVMTSFVQNLEVASVTNLHPISFEPTLTSSLYPPRPRSRGSLLSSQNPGVSTVYLPSHTLPNPTYFRLLMAPGVIAAARHITYDIQPPESLHRAECQINAQTNENLEHIELEMLITISLHIQILNTGKWYVQQQYSTDPPSLSPIFCFLSFSPFYNFPYPHLPATGKPNKQPLASPHRILDRC